MENSTQRISIEQREEKMRFITDSGSEPDFPDPARIEQGEQRLSWPAGFEACEEPGVEMFRSEQNRSEQIRSDQIGPIESPCGRARSPHAARRPREGRHSAADPPEPETAGFQVNA